MSSFSGFESNWVIVPQVKGLYETAHGVKTHYVCAGQGEPIILIHGGGPGASGATGWSNTIPALAEHFRVYAIDLIGNGDSDKPIMDYSLLTLVDHVAGFVDALNLKSVRIMGNSQGAYVAMKYALDHPGRVKAGAIISTGNLANACGIVNPKKGAGLPRFDGKKETLKAFMEIIVNDKSKLTDELIDTRFATASQPGHLEYMQSITRYKKLTDENPSHAQAWYVRERMQALRIPNIMIWGELDRSAPLDPLGLGMKALLPHIPFHVVKGAGHQVQNDKPNECNKLLVDHFVAAK